MIGISETFGTKMTKTRHIVISGGISHSFHAYQRGFNNSAWFDKKWQVCKIEIQQTWELGKPQLWIRWGFDKKGELENNNFEKTEIW